MKIDTSKIDGYEAMSPEQKLAALEGFEYEDGASEIARLKNAVSTSNKEAAEWKRKHNALLTEDEQKKAASEETMKQMQQELEELRKEKAISSYKARFLGLGYDEAMAEASAKAMAENDWGTVFTNQSKHQEAMSKKLKAELLKGTPTPPAGAGTTRMTKDDIMKIQDSSERQAAIAQNMDLFRKDG